MKMNHTKTLNIIQTLSKLGKIFSKIIYICCIVGFIGCAVGIVAMIVGEQTVKIGGVTLHSFLQNEAGISTGTIWSAIAVGMILCAGEFAVAKLAHRYFTHELEAGTPFTLDGAKELLHLGISVIWIPLASLIVAQIAHGIIDGLMENVESMKLDGFGSVALGVMFIFMSLLCRYGAELREKIETPSH